MLYVCINIDNSPKILIEIYQKMCHLIVYLQAVCYISLYIHEFHLNKEAFICVLCATTNKCIGILNKIQTPINALF